MNDTQYDKFKIAIKNTHSSDCTLKCIVFDNKVVLTLVFAFACSEVLTFSLVQNFLNYTVLKYLA